MKKLLSLVVLLPLLVVISLEAHDLDGDGKNSILIPINVMDPTPGAHGTSWVTELWFHNGAAVPVRLRECGIVGPPCGGVIYEPGVTVNVYDDFTEEERRAPLLLRFGATEPWYTFSSRLYELSRAAQPAGVYVPVVREEEFFTEPKRFVGIPGDATVRTAVRFYDVTSPFGPRAAGARIEVFDLDGNKLGEHVTPVSESIFLRFAEVHDIASLISGLPERFDLRVSPIPADLTFWALVSVTDNETQQVLLINAD